MSKNYSMKFAIFAACLLSLTATAAVVRADVKIKSRQTTGGQSYEHTTYIKGKRQRTDSNAGGMQMINITQCDLRRDVQIMPDGKVYMLNPFDDGSTAATAAKNQTVSKSQTTTELETGGTVTTTYTTRDTGERKQMFGYTARRLIITIESVASPDACQKSNSKMQMDGWYIDAAWNFQCDRGYAANGYTPTSKNGCRDKHVLKQVGAGIKRGYPVWEKMTMFDDAGKETMSAVTEVLELSAATLDASLFEIPADYREVKDSTQLYASFSAGRSDSGAQNDSGNSNSGMSQNVKNMAKAEPNAAKTVGPKKPGTIRIGVAGFKTGAVGEGLNAAELSGAIQNTLGEFLKGTKIELVALEAKLASALENEIKQKECDYVLNATVSHKKGGGGGFGMFSKIAPAIGNVVPLAGMGSRAGAIAGQVASTAVYTAANASGNLKSKDELTLDLKLNSPVAGGAQTLTKQFKTKAKSDGEDIISPLAEQAAAAILAAVSSSSSAAGGK